MSKIERELTIKRFFNAPKKLVYSAWTEPEKLMKWWCPTGFSTPVCRIDFRPGGEFYTEMQAPEGWRHPMTAKYTEVMPHDMLAFTFEAVHDEKTALTGTTTVTFAEQGAGTLLTMHTRAVGKMAIAEQMLAGMEAGWSQSFDKLTDSLEGKREDFVITRTFDAPRDLVYKMYSDAEHLKKWWGPKGFGMKVAKLDFRPGGTFLYAMVTPDGQEVWGKFYYRFMMAPMMIQFIVSFSDEHGNPQRHFMNPKWPLEVLNTLTLEEKGRKTLLTLRGGPINATEEEHKIFAENFKGMQQGFKGTLDQLEEYLNKVK
jgi:uncharacterized protein YndB with AHSA1/START domain